MRKKAKFVGCFILFLWVGCTKSNEEELFAGSVCETENVSYQAEIVPIMQNNCLVCHSTAAGLGNIRLQRYTDLISYIPGGVLMGSIRHDSGFKPMPQNGSRINDCDIEKLEAWIESGFPEN